MADPAQSRLAASQAALEGFLAAAAAAEAVEVLAARPLTDGAIQENWLLDLEIRGGAFAGTLEAVLRTDAPSGVAVRSEEHTSELQSLMRISYAVFCLKKKKQKKSV